MCLRDTIGKRLHGVLLRWVRVLCLEAESKANDQGKEVYRQPASFDDSDDEG